MPEKIAVLGASSQIGLFALPYLVARSMQVTAISRGGPPPGYPALPGLAWLRPEAAGGAAAGAPDCVLSAGPLELVRAWLRATPSIRRVVAFSTTSLASKAGSPDARERETMRRIADEEAALRAECLEHGASLCVLRPTLVYGCGLDRNVSLIARLIEAWGFFPVIRGATGLRQPAHAEDLARTAVEALGSDCDAPGALVLCGGSTLPYREMVEAVFAALQRRPRIPELSPGLLALAVRLASLWPGLRDLNPQMVRRQGIDLVFDDSQARKAFGHHPRPFRPTPDDFHLPTAERLRRIAGRN